MSTQDTWRAAPQHLTPTLPDARPRPAALAGEGKESGAREVSARSPAGSPQKSSGASLSEPAEDTGNTGDTGSTGNTSQTMFVMAGVRDAEAHSRLESPDSDTSETDKAVLQALQQTPRGFSRLAPALLLLGVIAYSIYAISEMSSSDEDLAPKTATGTAAVDANTHSKGSAARGAEQKAKIATQLPARGKAAMALLATPVERVDPLSQESEHNLLLGDRIDKRREQVSLINLWATWCGPCMRELPDLERMFDRASWGDKVRFLSVHTQTDDVEGALAFAEKMPSRDNFLIELRASGISGALLEDRLIEEAGLPITLVLDCRREVRFHHVGELTSADFDALQPLVESLVAELDTPFCALKGTAPRKKGGDVGAQPPSTAEATPPEPRSLGPVCGDDACENKESCKSCPKDCKCDPESVCKPAESGGYKCIKDERFLK